MQTQSPLPDIEIRWRGATKNWKIYHYVGYKRVNLFKNTVIVEDDPTQAMLKAIEVVKEFYTKQLHLLESFNV